MVEGLPLTQDVKRASIIVAKRKQPNLFAPEVTSNLYLSERWLLRAQSDLVGLIETERTTFCDLPHHSWPND